MIRVDTDRGALYGPDRDAVIAEFFGEDAGYKIHRRTGAGDGTEVFSITVSHQGGWLTVAHVSATTAVDEIPADATPRAPGFAVGPTATPQLAYWMYDRVQELCTPTL